MGIIKRALTVVLGLTFLYVTFLYALSFSSLQQQAIYLNGFNPERSKDLNAPEQWGFLANQVTPFSINTSDGETLYAWHIMPLETYRRHEAQLVHQPYGFATDVTSRMSFQILHDDPDALLVIFLHGSGGTLASGARPASYRSISSGASDRIHVVTVDYRGFGQSTGNPSEEGLLKDAVALANWAIDVAGIPASRIVIFGQSLGTAVAVSLADQMAVRSPPMHFSGLVLVAPFADVATLTATYRLGGVIPILSPAAYSPKLLKYLNGFIQSKWPSSERLAKYIRNYESCQGDCPNYYVSIIHALDDSVVPSVHSDLLYWHAVNASLSKGITYEEFEQGKKKDRVSEGAGGWKAEWRTQRGIVRQDVVEYGTHNKLLSYPVVSLAMLRAFHDAHTSSVE